MTTAFPLRHQYPRLITRGLFLTVSCLATTAIPAQWATNYLAPKIIDAGTNVRAGAVMAKADGGVITAFDSISAGARKIKSPVYDGNGATVSQGNGLIAFAKPVTKLFLLPSTVNTAHHSVAAAYAERNLADLSATWSFQLVTPMGENYSTSYQYNNILGNVLKPTTGHYLSIFYSQSGNSINIHSGLAANNPPSITRGAQVEDLTLFRANYPIPWYLAGYTVKSQNPGTPGEVWVVGYEPEERNMLTPRQIEIQPGVDQSKFLLTGLGASDQMATWLGEEDGNTRLYTKVIDVVGSSLSSARLALDHVVDYTATSSTLGIPVFAAVQRDDFAYPPMDYLSAGLINPANGGTLALPLATGYGVRIKSLRQEANGDFSLIYSIPENGTNLLKAHRVSGSTGATLWVTTVADLGRAPDKIIDQYPNCFVSGNAQSVLYILARYDQPGTANSNFQLIRLRPDGQMGADATP